MAEIHRTNTPPVALTPYKVESLQTGPRPSFQANAVDTLGIRPRGCDLVVPRRSFTSHDPPLPVKARNEPNQELPGQQKFYEAPLTVTTFVATFVTTSTTEKGETNKPAQSASKGPVVTQEQEGGQKSLGSKGVRLAPLVGHPCCNSEPQ